MLAETSISKKTRISSALARPASAVSGGRPSQDRSSGTGSTVIGSRVPGVALDGLHLHDAVGVVRQSDVDRHLGVGRLDPVEDILAEDRAIERGVALALGQIDLEPVLAPPWVAWRYDFVFAAGIGRLRRITMSLTVRRAVGADGDRAQAVRHDVRHPAVGRPRRGRRPAAAKPKA